MLTPMQKDALAEILNVNMGLSASLLSEMVNQKIILSVPVVELKQGAQLNAASLKKEDLLGTDKSVMTLVTFGKKFNGNALVIFPQEKANILANACLGNDPAYGFEESLSNEDADVIKEICNVILNAIVGEFGNLLDVRLEYTAFDMDFSIDSLDERRIIPPDSHVLVLYTSFFLTMSQVRGMILIVLSASSFDMLINKIDDMLRDIDV
ncbi:MAG: chemotaxis protein CheC [Bacillota bacterium]